jgi:hypothetical protein
MIRIRYIEERYAPVVICDICEQRITNSGLAVIVYPRRLGNEAELLEPWHVHKGTCLATADERLGGREKVGWEELATHLMEVAMNCGRSSHQIKEHLNAFESWRDLGELD